MKDMKRFWQIAPYGLLVVFACLCFVSQNNKSVTVDEFCHLPAGIYNLVTFDWRMDRESPPLVKCLPAFGALLKKPALNIDAFRSDPNPWSFGYDFMFRNKDDYHAIFVLGRSVIILVATLGGLILFRFASKVYGHKGGVLVLLLYVCNPNIIAHSQLTTIDMGATTFILLGIYFFWKFLKNPSLTSAAVSGVAMGLAQLSKFTALIFFPVFWLIHILTLAHFCLKQDDFHVNRKSLVSKHLGYMVFSICVSILIINTGYLFSGSFTPVNNYRFESNLLGALQSQLWGSLPVPLPYDYVAGFDTQLAISQGGNPFYMGYLMGERSLDGWWYYYLVAFVIKNPLALCVLFLLTMVLWIKDKRHRPDFETSLCIWMPLAVFFVYFSLCTKIPIGLRFLLPVFPLCFMTAGYVCKSSLLKGAVKRAFLGLLIGGYVISTMAAFPDYLSFFSRAVGGSEKGHGWLIDSNLDMGQDLPGLKKYMDEMNLKRIRLGYFGRVDPGIYGIDYTLAGPDVEKGPSAISINFLAGRPYYLLDGITKQLTYIDHDYYKKYRTLTPVKKIGHSIYVYNVKDKRP